jgi:hypothetical protein
VVTAAAAAVAGDKNGKAQMADDKMQKLISFSSLLFGNCSLPFEKLPFH